MFTTSKNISSINFLYLYVFLPWLNFYEPITVAARSKAWTVFSISNTGIVGSNPTQGMDVCLRLFCLYVVLCVGKGLARGWSPIQGVLPTVYRVKKLKKVAKAQQMAVEP
jgi:hypothetical protein